MNTVTNNLEEGLEKIGEIVGKMEGSVTIERDTDPFKLDGIFDVATMICALNRNDKHYKLKVENLIKAHGHSTISSENMMAKHRTDFGYDTKEDFHKFFKERRDKHSAPAHHWFQPEWDCYKLKHHYLKPLPVEERNVKSIEARMVGRGIKECDTPFAECRCWEITLDSLDMKVIEEYRNRFEGKEKS